MSDREPSILRGQPNSDGPAQSDRKAAPAETPPAAAQEPKDEKPQAPARSSRPAAPTFYAAGFWRRFLAGLVDLALIVPVSLILCWISGQITGVHLPPSRHRGLDFWLDLLLSSDPALFGIIGLTLVTATVYLLVFQLTRAWTPGMRVAKIYIIDLYGDAPSIVRVIIRTAGYLAAVATLGLGFVWIGFDSEKRGLHDWLSGTYVVKV